MKAITVRERNLITVHSEEKGTCYFSIDANLIMTSLFTNRGEQVSE